MKNLFDEAMNGIGQKVALQEIRKVIRGKDAAYLKMDKIIGIVHRYEEYEEQASADRERREMEAEEAAEQQERIDEMFDEMKQPLEELTEKAKVREVMRRG
jgi:hypothetical protein